MNNLEHLDSPEVFVPGEVVISVCQNGNGRSKEIAWALDELGYGNVPAIGVGKFPRIEDEDIREAVLKARVFVCATNEIMMDMKAKRQIHKQAFPLHGEPVFVALDVSEQAHSDLHVLLRTLMTSSEVTPKRRVIRDEIKRQLLTKGFQDFSQHPSNE